MTAAVTDTRALTPVEDRGGHLYKRDDLLRHWSGANGGKWRKCLWLTRRVADAGHTEIVSGGSVHSPQLARTAAAAAETGLTCTLFIGGTTVDKALRHPAVAAAADLGATFHAIKVGYNPALQGAVRRYAEQRSAGVLHYGVSPEPDAPPWVLRAFHTLGAEQVANLPPALDALLFPFGSGISAASLYYGLTAIPPPDRPAVMHLIGVGPSRWQFLWDRLQTLGVGPADRADLLSRTVHHDLIGWKAVTFAQKVTWASDGIALHPTYEAKVGRWVDQHPDQFGGWAARDGGTCLWIIGGPL